VSPRAAIIVAATAFVVCGVAAAENYPSKIVPADGARARAAVTKLSDLTGSGWKGGQVTPDLSALVCAGYHPKITDLLVTGAAESGFQKPDGTALVSLVLILKNARMVRLDYARGHAGGRECLRHELAAGMASTGGRVISVDTLAIPLLAANGEAYRARISVHGQPVVADFIAFASGRVEAQVAGYAAASYSAKLLAQEINLARRIAARSGMTR